jgi:hypothetical protein
VTTLAPRARARKEYVPAADLRPPIRPAAVADALERAAAAVAATEKERFSMPSEWAEMRRSFHTIGEAERRLVLLRLILDEGQRIATDRGNDWNR